MRKYLHLVVVLVILAIADPVAAELSAAIGAIIECRARVQEKWGDVRFIHLSKEVEDVIRMLGVDSLIVTCESLDEALWSFTDFADIPESKH